MIIEESSNDNIRLNILRRIIMKQIEDLNSDELDKVLTFIEENVDTVMVEKHSYKTSVSISEGRIQVEENTNDDSFLSGEVVNYVCNECSEEISGGTNCKETLDKMLIEHVIKHLHTDN
jgi:hypothetical protein